ncbi:hypothetical protein [Mammaliicoccus sp. E-M21]|nr:hypothetical protein [Mammaliicoccus sp. E-M21]
MTVLATRSADSSKNNSTVIGTLSVSRQVGITIAPTLFATFIQVGFSQTGTKIKENLSQAHFNIKDIPHKFMNSMQSDSGSISKTLDQINQIPNKAMRDAITNGIIEATHLAYMPVFLTAAIASMIILILVIVFKKEFKY